jgi:hypothetical protein
MHLRDRLSGPRGIGFRDVNSLSSPYPAGRRVCCVNQQKSQRGRTNQAGFFIDGVHSLEIRNQSVEEGPL